MSRNLINLGLLVVVLILVALVAWEPGKQQAIVEKLSSMEPDKISRIDIKRDGLQDIQLEKQSDHWQMLAPYHAVADTSRVDALLRLADTSSHAHFSAHDRKLSDYGFEPVLAQVSFDGSLIQFGSLEHISKRRYVLFNENIHLITDLFYHQLRTSATQFISPRLFNDEQRITRLVLADRQYTQANDGSWQVVPSTVTSSADTLNEWIENWQRLRANRISAANEKVSEEHISIGLADGSSLVFEILRSKDDVIFIRRDLGLQYHVDVQTADQLFASPSTTSAEQH